ncbi:PREDICTED: interleukin-1 receptor-associated kinase 1 [Nanorana parkeri]|uniref:interleukin-1 receptor-associated kinase 1 n=1 Tax=Nanorana parkeri TaxID=125878 RepID=UPI000854E9BE|nr:PREDICTED: interleukin-1 receptor-associated kinase 1 [Nanorana parkeri]
MIGAGAEPPFVCTRLCAVFTPDTMSIEDVFLYEVPAAVMCSFYEVMDSLDDSDWKKFASMIIFDQTSLRLLEQQGRHRARTEAVMWNWMHRNGRVGELLSVLQKLHLLRALSIFEFWRSDYQSRLPPGQPTCPTKTPSPPPPYSRPCIEQNPLQKREKSPGPPYAESEHYGTYSFYFVIFYNLLPLPFPEPPPPNLKHSGPCPSRASGSDSSSSSSTSSNTHSSIPESLLSRNLVEPSTSLKWTFQEVLDGTGNFSPSLLIGEGGFGCVYKATIRNTDYAVKRLKQDSELEWNTVKKSFHTEIEKLTCLRHPNIIDLAGYCVQGEEYCLIYLFVPNGSLEERLHLQGSFPTLTWKKRLSIVQGAACGIQFLHTCQPSIIHGDIKSSNILLDQALMPKIGDFGLSRFSRYTCDAGKSRTLARTSTVRGTLAYLPEEYVKMGKLTFELDTYSFGVVLLEVLTGQQAVDNESRSHTKYLKDLVNEEESDQEFESSSIKGASKVSENKQSRAASRICHQHLDLRAGVCPLEVAQDLSLLACRCLGRQKKRPRMVEVFNEIKRLQELLASMEMGYDGSDPCAAAYAGPGSFPPVSDLLSSLQDSILSPQENTDKFTICGLLVNDPALGSVRPYTYGVSQSEEDKPSSLCSLSSCESHKIFQRTPNLPVESDESIPEYSQSTFSGEHRNELRRPKCIPLHRGALQCRSTACASPSKSESLKHMTGQCHGSVQEGSSLSSSGSQAISMPHHQIVVNPAKQRFVEQLALYEQGKINSLELLYSGNSPGNRSEPRGYPEESDDFPS